MSEVDGAKDIPQSVLDDARKAVIDGKITDREVKSHNKLTEEAELSPSGVSDGGGEPTKLHMGNAYIATDFEMVTGRQKTAAPDAKLVDAAIAALKDGKLTKEEVSILQAFSPEAKVTVHDSDKAPGYVRPNVKTAEVDFGSFVIAAPTDLPVTPDSRTRQFSELSFLTNKNSQLTKTI